MRLEPRVLHGEDVLAALKFEPAMERFLCEQAIRNLRLRLVYAFVTRTEKKLYVRHLAQQVTPLFVQLSEALRLSGIEVPKDFAARVSVMEREFQVDAKPWRGTIASSR